jgi:hypothetical protein
VTEPRRTMPVDASVDDAPATAWGPTTLSSPQPAAVTTREPVWVPEQKRTPNLTARLDPATDAPPRVPSWEPAPRPASWPDARWEHASATTLPRPPTHSGARGQSRRQPPSRAFVTKVAVASLVVAFVAVAAIVFGLHASTTPSGTSGLGPTSTAAVSPAAVSHLRAATETIDTDTDTTRATLDAIVGIPTPAKVATVINPYVAKLQHYAAILESTAVPEAARTTTSSVRSLVHQDRQALSTITGLPSLRLGSYLEQFGKNSRQLQGALGNLAGELSSSTS